MRHVYRVLLDSGDDSISYTALTRYKKARSTMSDPADGKVRREAVLQDLETLSVIVSRGRDVVLSGMVPRTSEVLAAIRLRSELLTMFPDASRDIEAEAMAAMKEMVDVVTAVVTEDQRGEITGRLAAERSDQ